MGQPMQLVGKSLHLSASDLVGHLNCRYLTTLDLQVAYGKAAKPKVWDPLLELLVERGALHEQAYVEHLKAQGLSIAKMEGVGVDAGAVAETLAAMKAGVQVIVQGALQSGNWAGRADILRRVETPSALGAWSYEVTDTKLARETKGNTVLQLCLYSNLLAATQNLTPELAYVVTPETEFAPEPYRLADYAAYYRHVRRSLETAVVSEPAAGLYPEPIIHCDICRWRTQCDARRRADDHLSLVAGISRTQIDEFGTRAFETMEKLAAMPLPLTWKPERGAVESYQKVREQARIQVQGRTQGQIVFEPLPLIPGFGLARLPQPSEGDIFLDFEGDPFVAQGGLEFLFGYSFSDNGADSYTADWAMTRVQEKEAFERFVDFVMKRLEIYPDLHV